MEVIAKTNHNSVNVYWMLIEFSIKLVDDLGIIPPRSFPPSSSLEGKSTGIQISKPKCPI